MKKLTTLYAALVGGVRFLIAQITPTGALVIGLFGLMVAVSTIAQMISTSFQLVNMSMGEVIYRYTLAVLSIAFYGWRYPIAKREERQREAEAHLKGVKGSDWVEDELARIEREVQEGEVKA